MRKRLLGVAMIAGLLVGSGGALAGGDRAAGDLLAFQCAGCHGFNGHSVGPATPSLAGFPKEYFVDTMMAYKEGTRFATIMDRVAWGYTREDFEAMAGFFAAQPYLPARQEYDAAQVARGQAIHDQHCESCHSRGGAKVEDDTPSIAGQWAPYLRDSFEDFLVHGRPQPRGMQRRLSGLSAEDIEALVQYYASQQDPAAYAN